MTEPTAALLPTDGCRGCGYDHAPIGAPCPICQSYDRVSDMTIRWNRKVPHSLADAFIATDWEALAEATPGLEAEMTARLRVEAQRVRDERQARVSAFGDGDDPLTVADMAPLTKRLAGFHDVFKRWSKVFGNVAKAALDEVAVDAAATMAPTVNIPLGRGGPSVKAVREREKTTTWDDDKLAAVIAECVVAQHTGDDLDFALLVGDDGVEYVNPNMAYEAGLRRGAKEGVRAAIGLRTKAEWSIRAVKSLAQQLIGEGMYDVAKVADSAFEEGWRDTGEYKVTIEAPK